MRTLVQLALARDGVADLLGAAMRKDRTFRDWRVEKVETPDLGQDGVIVVDADSLDRLTPPLRNPERVVLITRKDGELLNRAWDAGIVSVVGDTEPLATAMMAILSAHYRVRKVA